MGDLALYRPILKRSWDITKKFKSLWFFGLFVAILGSAGEYEILTRAISNTSTEPGIISQIIENIKLGAKYGSAQGGNFWSNLWNVMSGNPGTIIAITLVLVLSIAVTIFFIWLGITSQIGLIRNVDLINKNKKVSINEAIDFAVKNFWPTFFANVGLKIILFILFSLLSLEITALAGIKFSMTLYYISFTIFAVVILVASFLVKYQIFFILLKKQKFFPALKSAWDFFTENVLISMEMAFILFVLHLTAAVLNVLLLVGFLALPVVLTYYFGWPVMIAGLIGIIGFIVMIALILLITSTLMTFVWSSWTTLFNRLYTEGGISKIIRGSMNVSQNVSQYFDRK